VANLDQMTRQPDSTSQAWTWLAVGLLFLQALYPGYWVAQITVLWLGFDDWAAFGNLTRNQISHASTLSLSAPFVRFVFLIAAGVAFLMRSRLSYIFLLIVIGMHLAAWIAVLTNPYFRGSIIGYIVLIVEAGSALAMLFADRKRGEPLPWARRA